MQPITKRKALIRRRPKTMIALLILVSIVFYVGLCMVTILKVRSFRKHPQRAVALKLFQGSLPHSLLGRWMLFKIGSESYNSDLLTWASESRLIPDSFWNRSILEGAMAKMPEEQRLELLPLYPLTPTERLLPDIQKALDRGRYGVLPVLSRMNSVEGPRIYRRWVEEKIVKPHNAKLFVASSGVLAQSPAYPFIELINTFWPQLTAAQKERVTAKLAAHFPREGKTVNEVFEWARSSLENGSLKMGCPTVALLGSFVSKPSLRNQALELIVQRANDIDAAQVDLLFYFATATEAPELAKVLAERIKDKNPPVLLEIIHHVAHLDILKAEEIASPFLSGPDSELKKGVIVVLVRHDSVVGKRMIDDTFAGSPPRKTLYPSSDRYESGNSASDMYCKLSTHDYKQTGKTWPTSYFRQSPSAEDVAGWKQFIAAYPWFPGTDDAYYRLAFSQFAQRDYSGCLATIKEYMSRDYWPDNDARPYVYHLLRNLSLASDFSDKEMPFLPYMRNIVSHPLANGLIGQGENLDSEVESIDWFLANPKYIQFLNTDVQTLKLMREVAQTIKESPSDSVCRLVAVKLGESESLPSSADERSTAPPPIEEIEGNEAEADKEADDIEFRCSETDENYEEEMNIYPAGQVQSVLYGIFHNFPLPPDSASKIQIPEDPGEEAMRRTARFLNDRFTGVSVEAVKDHSMDEMITLALLHSGRDFEKWQREFKPTMDFLTAVNNKDIPSVVAEKHLEMVKERRR
jgi:hypothetical protein